MRTVTGRRLTLRLAGGRAVCRFVVAVVIYGSAALAYAASGRPQQPPLVGVVGATVLVALLLWLLRPSIDRLVARVLLGGRADGYQVMRALTQQLAATLPVDEVAPRVAEAACLATGRSRAEVRLRLTDGGPWTRSWPSTATSIRPGPAVEVRHTGSIVGEIAVEGDEAPASGLSPWDRRMLDTLARPAGVALSTVRLTVELRQRKIELERLTVALRASRERLLSTRAAEQHRMRAEVAARVGTHLSAALAAVDACRAPHDCGEPLATAAREAELALDELRTIARGIHPPTLSEVGLAASLESWLARAQVDAVLDVPADLGAPGGPATFGHDITACLYFCAVTSMGNLARHGARDIRVRIFDRPGPVLRLEARAALAISRDTTEAVTDRIEAFGGTVRSELTGDRFALTATLPAGRGATP